MKNSARLLNLDNGRADSGRAEDKKTQNSPVWNSRILVVEDEREIARSYVEILAPTENSNVVPLRSSRSASKKIEKPVSGVREFEVTVAHDAETALAYVKDAMKRGRPFAMGFFDVLLGGNQDGFELVKQIREQDPNLLAVFVTAYNDRSIDSIQTVLGENSNSSWDYLNKPFSSGEILQKARNFTSHWNLQKEKQQKEDLLAEIQMRLMESERHSAVAAVARGVNHEFGNILMQIMGRADLAKDRSPEVMKEALTKILDATNRATDILDRFKHLASGSSYHGEKNMTDLVSLINEAIGLLDHQLSSNSVKICKIKMEKLSAPIHETSIMQVIVNLIINSMHAMGSPGQIDFSLKQNQNHAEICIRDYGPGIPNELIEKVREPFFTTKGDQGSGLGLAICSEIVEMEHQGQFVIRNHGVKGLEVLILLPLEEVKHEGA